MAGSDPFAGLFDGPLVYDTGEYTFNGNSGGQDTGGGFSQTISDFGDWLLKAGQLKLAHEWGIADPIEANNERLDGPQAAAQPAMYPPPNNYAQPDGKPIGEGGLLSGGKSVWVIVGGLLLVFAVVKMARG